MLALACLALDLRLSPGPGDWEIERRMEDRASLAAWNPVELRLRLHKEGRPLAVELRDSPPPEFAVRPARILRGQVAPRVAADFAWQIRPPRRGRYAFGAIQLRWHSALGLFRRQARFPAARELRVYPNLVEVKKYELLLRRDRLAELGLRRHRQPGSGSTFERLREYQPDDPYRSIAWKATARRGKPVVMTFEAERSQSIVAMLDVGRMMRSPVGELAKMDLAINAALLLAYVATRKGDRVGIQTFADRVQAWAPPRSGSRQLRTLIELLYAVEGEAVEPDYDAAFGALGTRLGQRSLVLVFTELTGSLGMERLSAQLARLRRHHLALLVTIGDPSVERLARQAAQDSRAVYERAVAEQLLAERRLALERLRRSGVMTLDVPADALSVAVIDRYLEIKARSLL